MCLGVCGRFMLDERPNVSNDSDRVFDLRKLGETAAARYRICRNQFIEERIRHDKVM